MASHRPAFLLAFRAANISIPFVADHCLPLLERLTPSQRCSAADTSRPRVAFSLQLLCALHEVAFIISAYCSHIIPLAMRGEHSVLDGSDMYRLRRFQFPASPRVWNKKCCSQTYRIANVLFTQKVHGNKRRAFIS